MSRIDFANKLKLALEPGTQAAAAVESTVPAVEAVIDPMALLKKHTPTSGTVSGAMVGFFTPTFFSLPLLGASWGHLKEEHVKLTHQVADKKKELAATEAQLIAQLTKAKEAAEKQAPKEKPATEGVFGAVAGSIHGLGLALVRSIIPVPFITTVLGGAYGAAIIHTVNEMDEKREELAKLEQALKAKEAEVIAIVNKHASASKEDLATEGVVSGAIGGAIAGTIPGVSLIHGAYRGHKIQQIHGQIKDVEEEIVRTKQDIANATKESVAVTEGLAGAAAGAVTGLVPGISTVTGAAGGVAHNVLQEKLDQKKEDLAKLKQRHMDLLQQRHMALLRNAREAMAESSADLESLIASAESEAVIAAPAGGTETIVADEAPHRVEDHLLAADACCDAMDSHLDEADKLHRAVAQLESLMTVVRGEPNGLSQTDAKYVTLAVEHITADFAAGIKLVPSIEAFGGPASSQEATLTLEGNVKEVATQIWAYLKALWAKFMAALKNMWSHLFGAAESLGRHAKNLEAKAMAISGDPREASVDIGPLAHRVAVGGQVPASLKGILTFMKLGELKSVAVKALDESEITAAVQKMSTGGNVADVAVDASMRESFKTMPILNRDLPGGVKYVLSDDGEVHREVSDAQAANTTIPVLSRVDLIHLGHEAGAMAAEAAGVLKDLAAATAKDAGNFLSAVNIEDEARTREVSHAVSVMVAERKRGLKLVSDAITDYLKAAQALVAIGEKCVAKYGAAGHVEQAAGATKAAVAGAVDSAKAAGAAVAAKVAPAAAEPAAASAAAA